MRTAVKIHSPILSLPNHKKIKLGKFASLLVISLLFLGFLSLVNILPSHAFTNAITNLAASGCGSTCTNPLTLSVTYATQGDLVLVALSCITSFPINTITDTNSRTGGYAVTKVLAGPSGSNTAASTGTTFTSETEVWFAKITSTGATTVQITLTSSGSWCAFEVDEGNTLAVALNSGFVVTSNQQVCTSAPANSLLASTQFSAQANQLLFLWTSYIHFTGVSGHNSYQFLAGTNQVNTGTNGVFDASGYLFTSSVVTGNTGTYENYASTSCLSQTNVIAVLFSTTGGLPPTGASQIQIGCASGYAAGTFSLTGNTTYYFTAYSNGLTAGQFLNLVNISAYVDSIAWGNGAVLYDIFFGVWVSNSPVTAGTLPSTALQWNNVAIFPFFKQPLSGSLQHLSATQVNNGILQSLALIPAGMGYAIGISADHNGVKLRTCNGSMNQVYSQTQGAGFFLPARLNTVTVISSTIALAAVLNTPNINNVQTVTTVLQTVTSVLTVTNNAFVTTTTAQFTISTLASPQGGQAIFGNLMVYLPIWLFPLIFGGMFGGIGLVVGLGLGTVMATLFGLIPIWVSAILVIMMLFILRGGRIL